MSNLRQSIFSNSWIELAARWILGLTFIYASAYKIVSPADFAKIVYGYGLFPAGLINLIAIIIPFLELVGGLALLLGTLTPVLVVPVFVVLLRLRFIHAEEAALERTFGQEYRDYRSRVGRWFGRRAS